MLSTLHIAFSEHDFPEIPTFLFVSQNINQCMTFNHHFLIPDQRKLDVFGYQGAYTFLKSGMKIKIGAYTLSFFSNFFIYKDIAYFDDFCTLHPHELHHLRSCNHFLYRTSALFFRLHQRYIFGCGKTHQHLEKVKFFSC